MRQFCLSSQQILEPLLIFCTHTIRFRDTRCCESILRTLHSIVPAFRLEAGPMSANSAIRDYMSSEVLKACISSLHEAYFVDLHKDLAQLIATILIQYSPYTSTPRDILCGLPRMSVERVDQCLQKLRSTPVAASGRQQRALVLDLLAELKGVSISEQGRVTRSAGAIRRERSKMQQEFMRVEVKGRESPDLQGVGPMFG
jgi:exportin-5